MKKTYYFEVSKEAHLASDENGQPSEAYLKASFPVAMTDEQKLIEFIANDPIKPEHLKRITAVEYFTAVGDEEESMV